MTQEPHLNHKHHNTLQQIFQHPVSHNLEWHDVVALGRHIGTVEEGENGHLHFTVSGISEIFTRSPKRDVFDIQEVLDIRHFLERAGVGQDGAITLPQPSAAPEELTEPEQHSHDQGRENAEQNRRTEQQLKTQQNEQYDRSAFLEGNAQSHQQGNRQK